jgi:hypothetical protein
MCCFIAYISNLGILSQHSVSCLGECFEGQRVGDSSLSICDLLRFKLQFKVPLLCLWEWQMLFDAKVVCCWLLKVDWTDQWIRQMGNRTTDTLGWTGAGADIMVLCSTLRTCDVRCTPGLSVRTCDIWSTALNSTSIWFPLVPSV